MTEKFSFDTIDNFDDHIEKFIPGIIINRGEDSTFGEAY